MQFEHDSEADAIYVRLSVEPYSYGKDMDIDRRIDYAADGTPVGIELLNVSKGINLIGLPEAEALVGVFEAAGISTCLVIARMGTDDLRRTTELRVMCGGRQGGTANPSGKFPYTVSLEATAQELPATSMGWVKPTTKIEALTR